MSFDDAYGALTDHDDDARWAYGTGFTDPLAGVPTEPPPGVDVADLAAYCLMLGDDALILSHRLQQWVTRAPELEDELAIANIALDLLGQARLLLARAGEVEGAGRDEDALAYLRDAGDFRNIRLAERADADFAHLVARLLVFATWRLALLDRLSGSADPVLAAVGAKGVKEVTYHREYSAQWVVRLGDGTELSHQRMQDAVDAVWPLVGELFRPHEIELRLPGVAVDPSTLRPEFDAVLTQVLSAATLSAPTRSGWDGGSAPESAAGIAGEPGEPGVGGVGGVAGQNAGARPDDPMGPDGEAAVVGRGGEAESGGVLDPGKDAVGWEGLATPGGPGGRDGAHGPELDAVLAELQGTARSLPGGVW